MAFALNDICEVKIVCRLGTEGAVNIAHFKLTTAPAGAVTESAMAQGFFNLIYPGYIAAMSAQATFAYVAIRRVNPGPATSLQYSSGAAVAGTAAGDTLPKQTCGLITKTTTLPGPTGRGRYYIPYPTEAHNDSQGQPTSAYQTLLAAIRDVVCFTMSGTPAWDSAAWSPYLYRPTASAYTSMNGGTTRGRWGTQRRRNNNRF